MLGNQYGKTHGMHETPTYKSWTAMKYRCLKVDSRQYPDYGGRGIIVCERWMKFENFLADMGERPEGRTLDRINNDGGYSPENCRWATRSEQQKNKRPAKRLDVCKRGHVLAEVGVYVNKSGGRQCKQCAKDRARRRRA